MIGKDPELRSGLYSALLFHLASERSRCEIEAQRLTVDICRRIQPMAPGSGRRKAPAPRPGA